MKTKTYSLACLVSLCYDALRLPLSSFVGIAFFLTLLSCPQKALSQERFYIDYYESFNEAPSSSGVSFPVLNKANRLKSNSAISFKILHDESVPDSVVRCLEVSADIWRSCLNMNSNHTIRLQLNWEELPDGSDVKITVQYEQIPNTQDHAPTSLYYSLRPGLDRGDGYDAKITINKNIEWDCGYSVENNIGVRNLTYAMLRSIGVALGFGTSLSPTITLPTVIKFPFTTGHSLFDNLLVSEDGTYLKDMKNAGGKRQNQDIIKFCTGKYGEVYIDGMNNSDHSAYKMYTSGEFEPYKSLVYLNNENSLMHYSLAKTTKNFQVDTITINVLNKLGWKMSVPVNLNIIGNSIPETGLTSAYTSHTFSIDGDSKDDVTNARWSFVLPSKDGEEILVKSAEGGLSFDIGAISNPNNFKINVNGDIYGKIKFSGILNGKEVNLQYNVTFELKPTISNVSYVTQKIDGYDSYNAFCKADYQGADYVYVQVEEEYGSGLTTQFVREPYSAHFVCRDITSPYYAWIDIVAVNQYGRAVYTIELPPYDEQEFVKEHLPCALNNMDNVYSKIMIYNANGEYLKTVNNMQDTHSLSPGIYVFKCYRGNKVVRVSKFIK